ncbi:efflux RND transporter periplasmic adaptor subunit [Idiomarina xiamenensis]|uniref:RND family efflux transporter MFP subunit n=1 Tax=Idiomarina xiamenensis 10-D-4 TaxID=740709 RepID=K2KHI9_9GAMM|nr:HlyD family efflux transporter periplasmic adaptor subunit [Idiomarina xiamenensis]EKE82124.1 RND family efflux transporter MFP subunit [Idiomarina xiamenensis 10-D-4]
MTKKLTGLTMLVVLLVVVIYSVVAAASGFSTLLGGDSDKALTFETLQQGDYQEQVAAYGSLSAKVRRSVVSQVAGTITEIVKQPGEYVNANDTILRLTNPEVIRERSNAQLALKEAEAALRELSAQLADDQLSLANDYQVAKADVKTQQAELAAREKLAELNIISQLELQSQRATLAKLELSRDLAKRRLDAFANARKAKLEAAEIKVERANNDLHNALQSEQALAVKAGMSGTLQSVPESLALGDWLEQGNSVGVVADPQSLIGELRVSAADAALISIGDQASVLINDNEVPATVTRIAPNVRNNQVQVDVAFAQPLPHGARSDIEVRSTIIVEQLSARVLLPRPPHYQGGSQIAVYRRMASGNYQLVQASVERASRQYLAINEGLHQGDVVLMADPARWHSEPELTLTQ